MNKLPEQCYNTLRSTGELVTIRKNEKGYFTSELSTADMLTNRAIADRANRKAGITKAQTAAMVGGSLFGWSSPAANPDNYDTNGNFARGRFKDEP